MLTWWLKIRKASTDTKGFAFMWIIYSVVIILTTVYCYFRLPYDRSYKEKNQSEQS